MNTLIITKSIKTILGVAILGLAALTQSFTENTRIEKSEKLVGEVWTNDNPAGDYSSLAEPYNPDNCQENTSHTCAYERTEVPGTVPESFNATQAAELEAEGLIEPIDNHNGEYVK